MDNIDYTKLRLSLKRLEEQHNNYQNPDDSLSELNTEAVMESTIHRFETCFDTLWKTLRRYLEDEIGIPDPPNGPKPIFRIAFENSILQPPLEDWFQYNQARVNTAHDYDHEKALACVDLVQHFIPDAIGLYQTMTGESWD